MQTSPDFDAFTAAYDAERAQVIWTTAFADLETPVSAMMKLSNGRPNSFLLESVRGGAIRGRYSFIGLKPDLIWRCDGDKASINRGALSGGSFKPCAEGSLDSLRALIDESRIELPESLPPMAAGLFGYMSYDMVRLMETLPDKNPDVMGTPDGLFVRPTIIAVFDTIEDIVTIVTPVRPAEGIDAAAVRRGRPGRGDPPAPTEAQRHRDGGGPRRGPRRDDGEALTLLYAGAARRDHGFCDPR
jgi:anthranilate synthase component 1